VEGLVYITIAQAVETHRKTVEVSGGGALGSINLGPLESVLEHIQNDLYYPAFEDKLTHLFFSANKFHTLKLKILTAISENTHEI
jgi:death-on-curing protein